MYYRPPEISEEHERLLKTKAKKYGRNLTVALEKAIEQYKED